MPSESDIVLARIRTTGIREERLKIDDQVCYFLLFLPLISNFFSFFHFFRYFNFLMLVVNEMKGENGLIVLKVFME